MAKAITTAIRMHTRQGNTDTAAPPSGDEPSFTAPPDDSAAARLARFVAHTRTVEAATNVPAAHWWRAVFRLTDDADEDTAIAVPRELGNMREQVALVRVEAVAIGVRPDRFEPSLTLLRTALDAKTVWSNPWHTVANQLRGDKGDRAMNDLAWIADVLADRARLHEAQLPPDAIQALLDAVNALERDTLASDLPEALRQFVASQLDAMRKAAREYGTRGAVALRDALERATWELARYAPELAAYDDKPAVAGLRKLWARIRVYVGYAGMASAAFVKVSNLIEAVDKICAHMPAAVEASAPVLPGVAPQKRLQAPKAEAPSGAGESPPAGPAPSVDV